MATYTLRYATNLAADPLAVPIPAQLARGDSDAYVFEALVYDSRDPQESVLAGTVSCSVVRPDGGTVTFLGEKDETTTEVVTPQGTFDATVCRATLPQAALAYPGRVNIAIRLIDGAEETTVLNVSAVVVRTATDTAIDPGEVVPNLEELLAKIEDCEDAAEAANDAAEAASTAMAGAVRFDEAQTIADGGTVARSNIAAAGSAEVAAEVNALNLAITGATGNAVFGGTDGSATNRYLQIARAGQRYTVSHTTQAHSNRSDYCLMPAMQAANADYTSYTNFITWCGQSTYKLTPGKKYRMEARVVSGTLPSTGSFSVHPRSETGDICGGSDNVIRFHNGGQLYVDFVFTGTYFAITAYANGDYDPGETPFVFDLAVYEAPEGANIAPFDFPTAMNTHTSGSLLMMGGQLYQATAAIASGEAITPGSSGNVAATSIAALFTPTVGAPTYVNNSYIEGVNFASSYYYKYPIGIAIISLRFAVTTALTSTNVKFGELGFGVPVETRVSIANQSGTGSCLVTIGTDGSISACAYGTSKPSGWGVYNVCITLPTT